MDTTYKFSSKAELRAEEATKLEPFGINLSEVRRTAVQMLGEIGRNGIFDQYTKHDISHIDEMLELLSWVIDDETAAAMTPADWLMIVLSIYFHDMGMLVTNDEFENRNKSQFVKFKDDVLAGEDTPSDYAERIKTLAGEEMDKFLYQEFVRKTHAVRIRRWIEGKRDTELGYCLTAVDEVERVLSGLDHTLRKDLALIAESHHLDDLDDLKKYNPRKSYGAKDAEIVNLQYSAILLRTVDLLHMRRDRTPSVVFRLINPADPVSQREWAKQASIKRVAPQMGKNAEGLPDPKASRDTIEVHAHFNDENGFFGLTFFLIYVKAELRKCFKWNQDCRRQTATRQKFVWRNIVDDPVETEGFLRNQFSFTLDQDKILDLLIGHTLYNDSSVVLRELIQNSIDAIRLSSLEDTDAPEGRIRVTWNSKERLLSVCDNGTGMSQAIIEDHLLKVGSSRYQDPKFKKDNPTFSPISRFGIGVLSAFMISDDIEITTCSRDDEDARRISLRSVHGRYLIRLLDKKTSPEIEEIYPHGTRFSLRVRHSAQMNDVVSLVKAWILIPACRVVVEVDGNDPVEVGFVTPKAALETFIAAMNLQGFSNDGKSNTRVIEHVIGGLNVAYAVRWSDRYRDWTMMNGDFPTLDGYTIPSTCIEGIAVDSASPGFQARTVLAVANATGKRAPKTNVARSSLERTPDYEAMTGILYGVYLKHIVDEIDRLKGAEKYSLTWAVENAVSLAYPILSSLGGASLPEKLEECIKDCPIFLIEETGGARRNASFNDLRKIGSFWTVDSALIRSTEYLVKEASGSSSVGAVLHALDDPELTLPNGIYLSNFSTSATVSNMVESDCEPTDFVLQPASRRIDVRWQLRGVGNRWLRMRDIFDKLEKANSGRVQRLINTLDSVTADARRQGSAVTYNVRRLSVPISDVRTKGTEFYSALGVTGRVFICPDTEVARFLVQKSKDASSEELLTELIVYGQAALSASAMDSKQEGENRLSAVLKRMAYDLSLDYDALHREIAPVIEGSPWKFFDSYAWSRRDSSYEWTSY